LLPVPLKFIAGVNGFSVIASVVVTSDKFITGDKNKDVMEVGSCQG
jgi:hypothetical protein